MDTPTPKHIHSIQLPKTARVAALVSIAIVCLVIYLAAAPASFPKNGGVFTIAPGDNLKVLGEKLEAQGFVRSSTVFSSLVTLFGGERSISPGDYFFDRPHSVFFVAQQIAAGNHNLDPIKVTIPEGENVREIGNILASKLPEFDAAAFVTAALPYEGYLFPETYFFYPKTEIANIIKEMRAMHDKKTASLGKDANKTISKDTIIMASIVEREAHGDDDRAMIAGILWRRLARGMPLQVDATVAYANNAPENQLTKEMFSLDSPFNTYKYRGLTPSPISNPGFESIDAALNPKESEYLYYIHDGRGSIHYAKTYAEHQKNIDKYLR